MRRRDDVDDIDIGPVQDFAKILIALDAGTGDFQGHVEMSIVDIADGQQPRARILEVPTAHASDADDGFRQLVTRGCYTLSAKDMAWNDRQPGRGDDGGFDKIAAGDGSLDGRLLFRGL